MPRMRCCWKHWNGWKLSSERDALPVDGSSAAFSWLVVIMLLPAAMLSLLPGCTTVRPAETAQSARQSLYQQRLNRLRSLDNWTLQGRLAISAAEEGGSGYLSWIQASEASRMDFHGALGRGAWRLQASADGVELEFADGRLYRADSIDDLVQSQVGWQVPVGRLLWWVRGLAAPGAIQHRVLDEDGRLTLLRQDDWTIEFSRYGDVQGETLPLKLTAQQSDRTVKLAIRKWELPATYEQQP